MGDINIPNRINTVLPVLSANITGTTPTNFTVDQWNYPAATTGGDFVVQIDTELLYIDTRTTTTLHASMRGFGGSTASTHNAPAKVTCVLTAEGLQLLFAKNIKSGLLAARPASDPAMKGRLYYATDDTPPSLSLDTGTSWLNIATAGGALADLSDVLLGTLADGDLLRYDLAAAEWKNRPSQSAGHYELIVSGSGPPPDPVTTPDGTDYVYGWVPA